MNCNEFKENIPEYISGELDNKKERSFEDHLSECKTCSAAFNYEKNILKTLSDIEIEIPEGLNDLVLSKIKKRNSFNFRIIAYPVAASIILIIMLSVMFNSDPVNNGSIALIKDTLTATDRKIDIASVDIFDDDLDDVFTYGNDFSNDDIWDSEDTDIFESESDLINDLITLEELESYDGYLSSL